MPVASVPRKCRRRVCWGGAKIDVVPIGPATIACASRAADQRVDPPLTDQYRSSTPGVVPAALSSDVDFLDDVASTTTLGFAPA